MENKLISLGSKEYRRIHDWIRKNKKHIKECEQCGSSEGKLDNALILGKSHEKIESNYIKLCRKCHYHYDHPEGIEHSKESKYKIGLASKNRILLNGVNKNFINARSGKTTSIKQKEKMSYLMTGEKHHQSKLTEAQVIDILRNSIETSIELSIKYNVSSATIRNIKNRKTWKKVTF